VQSNRPATWHLAAKYEGKTGKQTVFLLLGFLSGLDRYVVWWSANVALRWRRVPCPCMITLAMMFSGGTTRLGAADEPHK
jgi:hypothetical protein